MTEGTHKPIQEEKHKIIIHCRYKKHTYTLFPDTIFREQNLSFITGLECSKNDYIVVLKHHLHFTVAKSILRQMAIGYFLDHLETKAKGIRERMSKLTQSFRPLYF